MCFKINMMFNITESVEETVDQLKLMGYVSANGSWR